MESITQQVHFCPYVPIDGNPLKKRPETGENRKTGRNQKTVDRPNHHQKALGGGFARPPCLAPLHPPAHYAPAHRRYRSCLGFVERIIGTSSNR